MTNEMLLQLAKEAAFAAGEMLVSDYSRDAIVTANYDKDIKTMADVAAEKLVIEQLSDTGIPILSEERATSGDTGAYGRRGDPRLWSSALLPPDLRTGRVWLLDPIDGTLNFTRGFEMAAISIALWEGGEPLLGVVHDINRGKAYYGEVGWGARYSEESIRVSGVGQIEKAIVATGFPSGCSYDTESLLNVVRLIQSYKKVRMLGSAALMLAQVAAGHFDVYEEEDIYLWDIAAGLALVRAAGGQFTIQSGSGPYKCRVRADNGRL